MRLVKYKLNTIEVLISKALINSCINDDKFVTMDNVLREYNETKDEMKNPEYDAKYKDTGKLLCHL